MTVPVSMHLSGEAVNRCARSIAKQAHGLSSVNHERNLRTILGDSNKLTSVVWNKVHANVPRRVSPKHVL